MPSDRAIGCLEREHGLPGFLGEWHEAAVVLERRKAIRIVICECRLRGCAVTNYRLAVHNRNPFHPTPIGFDRPVQTDGVLQDDVADGSHRTVGHAEAGSGIALAPLLPFVLPTAESWAEIAETVQRIQVRRRVGRPPNRESAVTSAARLNAPRLGPTSTRITLGVNLRCALPQECAPAPTGRETPRGWRSRHAGHWLESSSSAVARRRSPTTSPRPGSGSKT